MAPSSVDDLDDGRVLIDPDDLRLLGRHAEQVGHRLDQLLEIQDGGDLQRPGGNGVGQREGAGLQLGLARPDAVVDAQRLGVPLLHGHPPLGVEIGHAEDAVAGRHAVARHAGEVGLVQGDAQVLVGQGVGGDGVLLAGKALPVDRQVVGFAGGIDRFHVHPDDAVLDRAAGKLVPRLLVEQGDGELHPVSRLGLADVGMDAQFDRAGHLARVVGAVKQVLAHVGIAVAHGRRAPLGIGHVAVVAAHALPGVGPRLPFQLRRLHPDAVGAHLVVAGAAELGLAQELRLGQVVLGRVLALAPWLKVMAGHIHRTIGRVSSR